MKVQAKNANVARVITHPNGAAFDADGISHWPVDQFTLRRIKDGDVTAVAEPDPGRADAIPGTERVQVDHKQQRPAPPRQGQRTERSE
jgi:hypothetical protein